MEKALDELDGEIQYGIDNTRDWVINYVLNSIMIKQYINLEGELIYD